MASLICKLLGEGRRTICVAAALAASVPGAVAAQLPGGHWTVAEADGATLLTDIWGPGQRQYQASRGQPVMAGTTVVTSEEGHAVLVRRGDVITVFANSVVTIPDEPDGQRLSVVQSLGKLLFRMETRESRNFEVRTPFLVAAVKGTVFAVDVQEAGATVDVTEGTVAVTPASGGDSQLVGAGWTAKVEFGRAAVALADNRRENAVNRLAGTEPAGGASPGSGARGVAARNSGRGGPGPDRPAPPGRSPPAKSPPDIGDRRTR